MMQSWATGRMAEEHLRELAELSRAAVTEDGAPLLLTASMDPLEGMARSTTGLPYSGGRAGHLALSHYLGNLLVRAGTRLGGAEMQAS